MFTGLSAFPLTPLKNDQLDETAFIRVMRNLVDHDLAASHLDSITVLGSTGSYAYLTRRERARAAQLAIEHAGDTPIFVGVGALRTSHVLKNIDDAQEAGAKGLLLAPVSYQPLTEEEVYKLFCDVNDHTNLPIVVYDNPGTTHFSFTADLYKKIAQLPRVASIKIPPLQASLQNTRKRITDLRKKLLSTSSQQEVTLGISGDPVAATALEAGVDAWYSVIAGTLPNVATKIMRSVKTKDYETLRLLSNSLQPLWDLFAEFGSVRVVAAIAQHIKLVDEHPLPLPIQPLSQKDHARVAETLTKIKDF